MTIALRPLLALTVLVAVAVPASAQDSSPRISVVQAGADALKADLEFMLSLTNEQEQEQLPILLDYMTEFQLGIDGTRPIRFDLIVENTAVRTRPSFPVSKLDDFLTNLDGFGIDVRKRGSDLYRLGNSYEGLMRYSRRGRYAWISEDQQDIPRSFNPLEGPTDLLEAGYDLAAQLLNTGDKKDLDSRRTAFGKVREELMAAVNPMEGESAEDFDLRKKLTQHQINEIERYFVEALEVVIGWTTDETKKEGRAYLSLEAIPETDLAASLQLLGAEPSYFANIPQDPQAVFSGRINHPLDELRSKQLSETFAILKARATGKIDGYQLTDDQKTASKSLTDQLYDMLAQGAAAGIMDAFIEVKQDDAGTYLMVGGFRSPAAQLLADSAELFASSGSVGKVETSIEEVGGVSIHRFTAKEDTGGFAGLFGDDRSIYVGTSDKAVWYAVGKGSLEQLKSAIALVAEAPKTEGKETFLQVHAQLGPWVDLIRKMEAEEELSEDREKLRKLALEAFAAGDSKLTAHLKREGDKVVGEMNIEPGVLRLVGKLIADFSAETLE